VLPRRLGARFALEALFLVLLAVGAGLAHLRPLFIVGVMAAAWILVALAELTAEHIDRSPVSYLLPATRADDEEEPERVFGPSVEEHTVVAPLEPEPEEEEPVAAEPEPEPVPVPEPEPVAEAEPEAVVEEQEVEEEPARPRRLRSFLRRQEADPEPAPAASPRHVKLLPRRTAPEPSRASQEVAELFGEPEEEAEPKEAGT
jgi:outer membrane biosynthesis protein TonB